MTRLIFGLLACFALVAVNSVPLANAAETVSPAFQYDEVDLKPALKKPVRVYFPSGFKKKNEAAEIVLRFVVTRKGDVTRMTVVRASHPQMIVPAMEAYEEAKFTPGMKDGFMVDTWMEAKETVPAR